MNSKYTFQIGDRVALNDEISNPTLDRLRDQIGEGPFNIDERRYSGMLFKIIEE